MKHTQNRRRRCALSAALALFIAAPQSARANASSAQDEPHGLAAPYELWLKIGQSNAVGTTHYKDDATQGPLLHSTLDAVHPRVFELSHGVAPPRVSRIGSPPLTFAPDGEIHLQQYRSQDTSSVASSDIGFHQTFGETRCNAHPEILKLVLSNNALGGSGLISHWQVGDDLFEAAVEDVTDFLNANPEYVFKGILWHQGESDAIGGVSQELYQDELGALVSALRAQIPGAANSVFIIGTMSLPWRERVTGAHTPSKKDAIHRAHLAVQDYIPNSAVCIFDDFVAEQNIVHFDRRDLRSMGEIYAAKADDLQAPGAQGAPPSYHFEYDAMLGTFRNELMDAGEILNQRLIDDGMGSMALTTLVDPGQPSNPDYVGYKMDVELNLTRYTKAVRIKLDVAPMSLTSLLSFGSNAESSANLMLMGRVGHGNYDGITENFSFIEPGNYNGQAVPDWLGDWHHLCLTYEASDSVPGAGIFNAYVNGTKLLQFPRTTHAAPLAISATQDLGRWLGIDATTLKGAIEEVTILPYALTDSEVEALASSSTGWPLN